MRFCGRGIHPIGLPIDQQGPHCRPPAVEHDDPVEDPRFEHSVFRQLEPARLSPDPKGLGSRCDRFEKLLPREHRANLRTFEHLVELGQHLILPGPIALGPDSTKLRTQALLIREGVLDELDEFEEAVDRTAEASGLLGIHVRG